MPAQDTFFTDLPAVEAFSDTLQLHHYQELPDDWWVVVTDLEGSTQAIEAGRYRDVNALGGCTVAAVLNATQPLQLPYVFGGDGATFCIPPSKVQAVRNALLGCMELARDAFQLSLRCSLMPYARIRSQAPVLVARYRHSANLQQAFFTGGGLQVADRLTKASKDFHLLPEQGQPEADFSGFECRWKRINSPREVTVSLLVQASGSVDQQLQCYEGVIQTMQQLLGNEAQLQPLTAERLQLAFDADKLSAEASVRNFKERRSQWLQLLKLRCINLLGLLLMKFDIRLGKAHWGRYRSDAVASSDYRKLDDTLRMVFAADRNDLDAFNQWLDQQQQQGQLIYGQHISDAAQLTCLVSQTGVEHIHFVDGCDGGYALAARSMKQKR